MCAIGRGQDSSIGAQAPSSTMLGAASIAGSPTAGPTRVAGGMSRGTLLTGGGPGAVGGGGPTTGTPRYGPPINVFER